MYKSIDMKEAELILREYFVPTDGQIHALACDSTDLLFEIRARLLPVTNKDLDDLTTLISNFAKAMFALGVQTVLQTAREMPGGDQPTS